MSPASTANPAWLAVPPENALPDEVAAEIGPVAKKIGFVPNVARLLAITPDHFLGWWRYFHHRVRTDRVDSSGVVTLRHNSRLHHIGLGRALARTPVTMLIDELRIRVLDADTGDLLRELILDPTRDYQPTGPTPRPTTQGRLTTRHTA